MSSLEVINSWIVCSRWQIYGIICAILVPDVFNGKLLTRILWTEMSFVISKTFTNYWSVGISWWRHQMETFSALLAICAGNSPVTGEFPAQRPVTRSFDVFFDLRLNKRLSKHSQGWWFETLSRPLWRHRNVWNILQKKLHYPMDCCVWGFVTPGLRPGLNTDRRFTFISSIF